MGVLKGMFYVFLFLDLVSIFCFFFNKGKIASNKIVFNAIGVLTFVLCFMLFSYLYARLLLTVVIVFSTLRLFVIQ